MTISPEELDAILSQLEEEEVIKRKVTLGSPTVQLTSWGRELIKRAQRVKG